MTESPDPSAVDVAERMQHVLAHMKSLDHSIDQYLAALDFELKALAVEVGPDGPACPKFHIIDYDIVRSNLRTANQFVLDAAELFRAAREKQGRERIP